MENSKALLLVNTWMCMLVRDTTKALVNAVELVHLRKPRMQNTNIALNLTQIAIRIVNIFEHFVETVILRQNVCLLLESIIYLAQLLGPQLILVVALLVVVVFELSQVLQYGSLRTLRCRALDLALACILETLELLLIRADGYAALIVREPLKEVCVLSLKGHALGLSLAIITVFCIILPRCRRLLDIRKDAFTFICLLALVSLP